MAKETKEERRERVQKSVAKESAARREAYFQAQAEAKAGAAAIAPDLPAADAYKYSYAWRQDVSAPTGEQVLIKNVNPYYDAVTNTILDPATGKITPATQSMFSGPSRIRAGGSVVTDPNTKDPKTGLTLAQTEAAAALAAAKGVNTTLAAALGATIDPKTGKIIASTIDPAKAATWYASQSSNVSNNANTKFSSTDTGDGAVTGTGLGTGLGTDTATTTRTLGRDKFKNSLALFFGAAEAAKPWVDALYDVVSKFYRTGSSVDESFNLALQDARNNPALKPFTDRFKGIYALQDLKLTGKPVLVPTIAEYVVSQAKMADVLTQANLGSLATDEFTTELISKGNSVTTIAEKIAKVYQRIDMAPKAIKDTLGRYFPTVDRTTLAKTLLTGQKGVDQLVDELEQYEVLAAAEGQGLGAINRIGGVDLARAQEYARSGQTFASLTPQFSRIARALPTTTKLSEISRVEDIGQIGLERALISQSADELERLELLGEQEIARYSGKAGRAELPLASQRRANRAF